MDKDYVAGEIERVRRLGPNPGETWFRLRITGAASMKHVNVSPEAVAGIAALLAGESEQDARAAMEAGPSPLQRIADILAEPSWSVGMLEDIAAIVAGAGVEPRAEREPYCHH